VPAAKAASGGNAAAKVDISFGLGGNAGIAVNLGANVGGNGSSGGSGGSGGLGIGGFGTGGNASVNFDSNGGLNLTDSRLEGQSGIRRQRAMEPRELEAPAGRVEMAETLEMLMEE